MNVKSFDNQAYVIEKDVDYTAYVVTYFSVFNKQAGQIFDKSLKNLEQLLQDDAKGVADTKLDKLWFTAHRLVVFDRLHVKVDGIRNKILEKFNPPYFTKKIQVKVLPSLAERIKTIKSTIFQNYRLPFAAGNKRFFFYKEIKCNLQLDKPQGIEEAEKEYVHLVGNHLKPEDINILGLDSYGGSVDICSLYSWMNVLKAFQDQGNTHEKAICAKFNHILQKVEPFFLKTSYGLKIVARTQQYNQIELEKAYLSDLEKSLDPRATKNGFLQCSKSFYDKYNLDNPAVVPKKIIYNEIILDMLELINQLKEGHACIFSLGTKDHAVLIEVACQRKYKARDRGQYTYSIFNTGDGVRMYHQLNEDKTMAYPLRFQDVPYSAFSSALFSELVELSLEGISMQTFYQCHEKYLVTQGSGKKIQTSGKLYPLQKLGICSYSSMEAWICSYFDEAQNEHLRRVKITLSTQKQQKVIDMLSAGEIHPKPSKKRKATEDPPNAPDLKKIKASHQLLKLGKELLAKKN